GLVAALTYLAVRKGKYLQPLAGPDLQRSGGHLVAGDNLVTGRRAADRQRGWLSVPYHREGPAPTRDDVDVFGMVIEFDGRVVTVGRGALIVQRPRTAQREFVGGQRLRVFKRRGPFVIHAGAAVVDHLSDPEVRFRR